MKGIKWTLMGMLALFFAYCGIIALSYDSAGFGLIGTKGGSLYLIRGLLLNKYLFVLLMVYLIWTLYKASKVVTDERNLLINIIYFAGKWIAINIYNMYLAGKFTFNLGKGVHEFVKNSRDGNISDEEGDEQKESDSDEEDVIEVNYTKAD